MQPDDSFESLAIYDNGMFIFPFVVLIDSYQEEQPDFSVKTPTKRILYYL